MLTFAYYWFLTQSIKAAAQNKVNFNNSANSHWSVAGDIIIVLIICFTAYTILGPNTAAHC